MQKDIESWCQRCSVCGKCKAAARGHIQLQHPTYGAFNERVSVDLMGSFKTTQNGNDYIVVMQDHFTKWVEDRAICGKEALTIADAVVQDWILKHHRTYSTAYHPQANGMLERCNGTVGLQHGEDTSVTRILRLFSNLTNFQRYVQKCLFNTVQKNGVRST